MIVFDDNFSYFSSKPYVVTPHLNRLLEMVQMSRHNIRFYAELKKNFPKYHQILPLIQSSVISGQISPQTNTQINHHAATAAADGMYLCYR